MKNSIVVKIPFSYKGQLFEPKSRINLEEWLSHEGRMPFDWVEQVAAENGIGGYSYELEVMESSELLFESPTGLAIPFYDETTGHFDFDGFKQHWYQNQTVSVLADIHQSVFAEPVDTDSKIYQAMLQAYQAGQDA